MYISYMYNVDVLCTYLYIFMYIYSQKEAATFKSRNGEILRETPDPAFTITAKS